MARMIFDLTDDDRAALEQIRAARGLRSHAETLRALIRENNADGFVTVGTVKTAEPQRVVELPPPSPAAKQRIKGTVEPASKRTPFKSRLKGDWKAP